MGTTDCLHIPLLYMSACRALVIGVYYVIVKELAIWYRQVSERYIPLKYGYARCQLFCSSFYLFVYRHHSIQFIDVQTRKYRVYTYFWRFLMAHSIFNGFSCSSVKPGELFALALSCTLKDLHTLQVNISLVWTWKRKEYNRNKMLSSTTLVWFLSRTTSMH